MESHLHIMNEVVMHDGVGFGFECQCTTYAMLGAVTSILVLHCLYLCISNNRRLKVLLDIGL